MFRLTRVAGSSAMVMAVYAVYATVAVPLIEPSLGASQRKQVSRQTIAAARDRIERRADALADFFPPGSWERENPVILESDQVKLLIGEYTRDDNGEVNLNPCTILFAPGEAEDDPAQRRRKAVILQAPQGATLRFDSSSDLARGKIGKLAGGRLHGKITIRGEGEPNDPTDDLLVVTRDVQLTAEHIWTPHPVEFRWGPHHGRGREMHLRLLPGEDRGRLSRGAIGPNIGGLESFELIHVEQLHLEVPDEDAEPANAQGTPASLPVDVHCEGPFLFNAVLQTASFSDRVAVIRSHDDGRNDQLDCDTLTVFFAPRESKGEKTDGPAETPDDAEKPPSRTLDLEPRRIEARGAPVVVRAPRNEVEAQGETLEYDLTTGRIALDGAAGVFLRQGANQVHTAAIQYEPSADGRLGRVAAKGPGRLTGQMNDTPDQQFAATWNKQLWVRPDPESQQTQVISLAGGAELHYGAIGKMSAGEIHFFLNEAPSAKNPQRFELQPDRMRADGNVVVSSPQLSAAVEQLEVWFEPDADAPGGFQPHLEPAEDAEAPAAPSAEASAEPSTASPAASPAVSRHFQLTGRLLQASLALRGDQPELNKLILKDRVELIETRTRSPDDKPTIIRGEQIELVDASSAHGSATITGCPTRPAHFESQGLGLTGANINVHRGANRVWCDGPGCMDLPPMARDFEGRPIEQPMPMRVVWQHAMEFDGRTVRFKGSVVATGPTQRLLTDVLEVSFQQSIRFDQLDPPARADRPPDVQEVRCHGAVRLDSQSFEAGQQQAVESLEWKDLVVDFVTGNLSANGRGWVRSTRLGGPGQPLIPNAAPAPPDAAGGLTYLYVGFQRAIRGNVHAGQRQLTFHDQVRATYGPVGSWHETLPDDNPDALGPNGAQLDCERLTIVEMPTPLGPGKSIGLVAEGNASVKGRDFTARGARITFDQSKSMLILEGDGRTDAFLSYQKQPGVKSDEIFAQKIQYWPESKKTSISGFRSLDIQLDKGPRR